MPRSKKNSKQNLPLDLQAQLHKKTWVKTEHDKAVQVHHDNIDRYVQLDLERYHIVLVTDQRCIY